MNKKEKIDIEAFKAGDERAFAHVVTKFQRLVTSRASDFLKVEQDIEDVRQEAFAELHRSRANFENEAAIKGYLYKVASNKCRNLLEKNKPFPVAPEDLEQLEQDPLPFLDELTLEVDRRGDLEDIERYSQHLSREMRDTLHYFYKEELPAEEIARLMKVSTKTVYYRIGAAKTALRKLMKSRGIRIFFSILFSIVCAFILKKIFAVFGI